MKPTTKLHHKVWNISQKLNPLTENAKALAIKNVFKKYGTTSRKTIFCLECSHSWKEENAFKDGFRPKTITCPSCRTKIEILPPSTEFRSVSYFTKIEAKDNFQVTRIFVANKYMKKSQPPIFSTTEVIQHFVGLDGRVTSMAMPTHGMAMYYDSWRYGSELSIMANDFLMTNKGRIEGFYILPRATFLKEVTRNGFNGDYYDLAPQNLFSLLLSSPHVETLIKTNQFNFIQYFKLRENEIKKNWNSIKICIRNAYEIKDATIWLDYVKLLEHFGKDLSSTKYVCPTDLHKAHDKLVDRKRRQDNLLKAEELKKKLKDQERAYKKAKKAFFGISFSNGNITIKVLGSVKEFIAESRQLKHCVYTSEYFSRENSLILSARIDNKPIETIEVSLKEMKIVQSRGLQNKASNYNKEIKSLVKENLYQIQQITKLKSA
nr:PcfJ domain-containing protein [uncultured Flavobacterium sp.]